MVVCHPPIQVLFSRLNLQQIVNSSESFDLSSVTLAWEDEIEIDNMAKAIEMNTIEDFIKESEVVKYDEDCRTFQYKLNDKSAKQKLIKGAKRIPFEIVDKSLSSNLVFSIGAWNNVVLPSVRYWDTVKLRKSCVVEDTTVTIESVKSGNEVNGKHIDTQIVFLANREKTVCHFYNTTQLILCNGHGYTNLIKLFLKPYFECRINGKLDEIRMYNEQALISLGGGRGVKRSDVKVTAGSTSLWCTRCNFAAKNQAALSNHKKSVHSLTFQSKDSTSTSLDIPRHHSTRNNSLSEVRLMPENRSITDISKEVQEVLKFTCKECKFKTKAKGRMEKHVHSQHSNAETEQINFVCGQCNHAFVQMTTTHM